MVGECSPYPELPGGKERQGSEEDRVLGREWVLPALRDVIRGGLMGGYSRPGAVSSCNCQTMCDWRKGENRKERKL